MAVKPENPKYKPNPYVQMLFPGQQVQTDNEIEFTDRFTSNNPKPNMFEKAPTEYIKAFLKGDELF